MLARTLSAVFAVWLTVAAAPRSFAQIWEAAADYSSVANPNGAWSYGWTPLAGGPLTLFTNYGPFCGGVSGWRLTGPGVFNLPLVGKNHAASTLCCTTVRMPPGRIIMHPGFSGQKAILRWTAPASGSYYVSAAVGGLDFSFPTNSDFALRLNGVDLLATPVSTFDGPSDCATATSYVTPHVYAALLTLVAGDVVDAVVGYGTNLAFNGDSTLVDLSIVAAGVTAVLGTSCNDPSALNANTPVLGQPLTMALSGAPPAVSGVVFMSVPGAVPLVLAPGCLVYLDLPTIYPLLDVFTDAAGNWSYVFPLPLNPTLSGFRAVFQGLLAPTPTPAGYVVTNGLDITL